MTTKEIEEKLNLKYNAKLVNKINYEDKEYIKAVRLVGEKIEYIILEIKDDDLEDTNDTEFFEYYNSLYKSEDKNIIY